MPIPSITYPPANGTSANTLQDGGQHVMADSHPVVIASDQTPIAMMPPLSGSVSLTVGGAAVDMTKYTSLMVQIDELSGGDAVTFLVSATQGGVYYPVQIMPLTGTFGGFVGTATVAGQYSILCAGLCWVKATKTGSASTPAVTVNGA